MISDRKLRVAKSFLIPIAHPDGLVKNLRTDGTIRGQLIHGSRINSTNSIVTGIFYHVVGTFDGKWARFYVNGEEQGAAYHPFPVDYGSRPMFFGT